MPETTEPHDEAPTRDAEATAATQAPARPNAVEGLVVALAPDYFEVYAGGAVYLCRARGRLRKTRPAPASSVARIGSPVAGSERPVRIATGDCVLITILGPAEGVIEEVLPRRNALSRTRSEVEAEHVMMANVDLAALVFAVREPEPRLDLLDRYLALCEHARIPALILFNKSDLGVDETIAGHVSLYTSIGYPVLLTSARDGSGLDELRAWLAGRTSLLTGPSGVGKSSLMNALLPEAGQRTGEVSEATGQGRHTTTGARLLPLPEGGWLADTAGIRELALWNAPPDALPGLFVELRPAADDCEYEDCSHADGEEGCALRAALAEGRITPARWDSFQRLLEEARERERPIRRAPARR
ncbi:MAG TPA: ribosome small subunit-dependent GTPase A [Ktedonobacterales bacterium]|nr:ribosome small subunit-dependent GTPase A [Ktedonobacterales bacterium]